jgi:hypothetical protein
VFEGLGAGDGAIFCDAYIPEGWVSNASDEDDFCFSNIHDCEGVCDGTLVVGSCGICGCLDAALVCAGIWFGDSVIDMCDVCDSDSDNDCVQDCAGEWGGTAVEGLYYYDGDSDGLGAGDAYTFCDALLGDGWVDNADDSDDFCFSNIHDCEGVCDGAAVVDDCGVCNGGNAALDCAGVCFGNSSDEVFEYHEGNNLISFYSLPEDASLNSIFEGLDFYGILGEGNASAYIGDSWYGSLDEINRDKGYWVQSNLDQELGFCGSISDDITYTLHDANNLLSYPFIESQSLNNALPDAVEDEVFAIVGEGVASLNLGGNWAGSLSGFDGGSGYWFAPGALYSNDISSEPALRANQYPEPPSKPLNEPAQLPPKLSEATPSPTIANTSSSTASGNASPRS